eukprot:scaffold41727_cov144-Skeletonema_dohrnii-CCMP3373.AAC.2
MCDRVVKLYNYPYLAKSAPAVQHPLKGKSPFRRRNRAKAIPCLLSYLQSAPPATKIDIII